MCQVSSKKVFSASLKNFIIFLIKGRIFNETVDLTDGLGKGSVSHPTDVVKIRGNRRESGRQEETKEGGERSGEEGLHHI